MTTSRYCGGTGSSPHTRGALGVFVGDTARKRIIPAYAGSTRPAGGSYRRGADHPRIRGEHHTAFTQALMFAGSSPHTRGAPGRRREASGPRGIIPAYAGSTDRGAWWSRGRSDHPRIRGEHKAVHISVNTFEGSSPHTRGAPARRRAGVRRLRIIPAYAGSTPRPPTPPPSRTDHPRIRGEHGS